MSNFPHIVATSKSVSLYDTGRWLAEHDVLIGEDCEFRGSHCRNLGYIYAFSDPQIAIMFKLSFGGS